MDRNDWRRPEFRRRGIGRDLLSASRVNSKRRAVRLSVRASNDGGIKLYEQEAITAWMFGSPTTTMAKPPLLWKKRARYNRTYGSRLSCSARLIQFVESAWAAG